MDGWSLQDKVVLITGGARGIGAACAREFVRRGAMPVLADLDAPALAATAADADADAVDHRARRHRLGGVRGRRGARGLRAWTT